MQKDIEIKPLGSYLEIDKEGYVINPASLQKIQEEWEPVISDVVSAYKKHFGEKLKCVYIRGSAAKGQAVKNISDIDSISYIDLPKESIGHEWEAAAEKEIKDKHSFLGGAELSCRTLSAASKNSILLNQAVCVYGEPVIVPKIKPGRDMMLHIPHLEERIELLEEKLRDANSEELIQEACVWFAKDMLRTGFELTMDRSKRYTRDLYFCYKGFSEYYPNKEAQMKEILHYALNPTASKEKIQKMRDGFAPWLIEEARKYA